MRKTLTVIILAAIAALPTTAQSLKVAEGNVSYIFPATEMGEGVFTSASTFEILGRQFSTTDVTEMTVTNSEIERNTVEIAFNGTSATVAIAGNIARYVTATIDGAHVSLTQSSDAGEGTSGEISYILSGNSDDGGFAMTGSYKATIELRGLNLTNLSGPALDIQNGKRIALSAKAGTENTLADGPDGSHKGAIVCKGHLELKGKGSLSVAGHTSHAIYAKEYVEMKNATVDISAAVKDGINCTQYFLLESGALTITGVGDDGIQTDFKDADDRETEDTGTITIAGGCLKVDVTATAAKGLKAEGNVDFTGGATIVSVSGKGKWDSTKLKTKASSCISADGDINVTDGTITLTASGSGGKGMSCDGTLTINGGSIDVTTTGGIFAYVNGKEYDGYTGNTDNLDSDLKSSPKGMKADTEVIINGGNINILTTGNGAEGIESKGILTVNDGQINIQSKDDGINSSSHMYIKGGDITVVATDNDALDSNGNLYIQGGIIRAFGASAPECGIDANEEEGYSVFFTGGTLIAVGGGNSTPSSTASTQPYVSGSGACTAGASIELRSGDNLLAAFTVPENYAAGNSGMTGGMGGPGGFGPGMGGPGGGGPGNQGRGSAILITCPGLTSGSSYTLVNGSSSSTVTATLRGSSGGGGRPF